MDIKRVIFVENISDIDFSNVGLHWTSNMDYIHTGGGENGFSKGRYRVEFISEGFSGTFNAEATKESNNNFPKEQEVILCANQEFDCMVSIMDEVENYEVEFEEYQINTGTRCDKWVKNF